MSGKCASIIWRLGVGPQLQSRFRGRISKPDDVPVFSEDGRRRLCRSFGASRVSHGSRLLRGLMGSNQKSASGMPFQMKLLLHQRYRFGTTSSPTRGCAPEPSRHHTGQKSCVERVFTLPAPAGKGRTRQRKPRQYPASAGTAIAQCVCPGVLLRATNVNAGRSQQSSPAALRQAPLSRVDEVEFGSGTCWRAL
ncbi:hypothetical protein ACVILI_006503 [Mesorhizobium sp. USDA 4775]|uniref:Uncharacterized protein n=1 Tax=Mesorhizobium qingshengii TaxID=1165689 RepID=A0A1G5ZZV3_9HYPH|nr:hypothetical protein SAMN02927914_06840 [Mesorhizobium qingshengii]